MSSWHGGKGRADAGLPLAPQTRGERHFEDQESRVQWLEGALAPGGGPPTPSLFVASHASAEWQQPVPSPLGPLVDNRLHRLSPGPPVDARVVEYSLESPQRPMKIQGILQDSGGREPTCSHYPLSP